VRSGEEGGPALTPSANLFVRGTATSHCSGVVSHDPSFALIGSYELLMRQVRRTAAGTSRLVAKVAEPPRPGNGPVALRSFCNG
jgi:hypothetical protein